MERSSIADKILKEVVTAGYNSSLLSTLAIETKSTASTALSVLKTMQEIHPSWYSIRRRCKTDIEVRVNFHMLPHVSEFFHSGGYKTFYPDRFQSTPKISPHNALHKVGNTPKPKWISVAAILASLLFVAVTWYIIRH